MIALPEGASFSSTRSLAGEFRQFYNTTYAGEVSRLIYAPFFNKAPRGLERRGSEQG